MDCPFLRETRVKSCQASAWRKMIVEAATVSADERCSSAEWRTCPAAAARHAADDGGTHCPYLREAAVEFCAAAALPTYVPASNDLLTRCKSDGHHYCELYLTHADPSGDRIPCLSVHNDATGVSTAATLPVPPALSYAPNHMWLDVAPDGFRHVGIDALLARVLGPIDRIRFVSAPPGDRPVAVLTLGGVDLPMVFPRPLKRVSGNHYLRTDPRKLTADPYGAGWLFAGAGSPLDGAEAREGLLTGDDAAEWMEGELSRLDDFVHRHVAKCAGTDATMPDGGEAAPGFAALLEPDDLLSLYDEFFAPHALWRR
jgi:glycine cleavage system H lipoate-binding protein